MTPAILARMCPISVDVRSRIQAMTVTAVSSATAVATSRGGSERKDESSPTASCVASAGSTNGGSAALVSLSSMARS
jgi:hypothetical protein